nr:hypothetical protein [Lachnospiraceae bacterium]
PSNVILTKEGSVRLLDLDAARVFRAGDSRDTKLIGTKGYAAPEQYGFGASGPATDIYAMGVLMNMLLTGAFPGEKLTEDPPMRAVIQRCIRLEPGERYASAAALEEALGDIGSLPAGTVRSRADADGQAYGEISASPAPPSGVRRFLPPGFRSGNPGKMLAASLWYILMFLVVLQGARDDMVLGDKLAVIVFTVAGFLGLPAIYCNYLGLQDRIGISRIRSKGKRFWACFGIFAAFLVAVTAFCKLVQMLLGGSA